MRLTAFEVQRMIGVPDREVVAFGYRPFGMNPRSLYIWFENRHVVRVAWDEDSNRPIIETYRDFDADLFQGGVKRWYEERFNNRLRTFLETFGDSLPMTKGNGMYPEDVPNVVIQWDEPVEPTKKYRVVYSAKFETIIDVPEGENPEDVAFDIDVPESGSGTYTAESFEVEKIEPAEDD